MRIILACSLLAAAPSAAAERSYTLTSFDRIRVEGPYAVNLVTNRSPFARASGSARALEGVSLRVEGRTLYVRTDRSAWGDNPDKPVGPVTISLGTYGLAQASLNGAGSLAISRVRGLSFSLIVSGSGSAAIADVDIDELRVSVAGSGQAKLSGRAKQFTALVRGVGGVDSSGLSVKDATLSAHGPATIRASASNSAKINASGTASIAIEGGAACTLKISGSADVTGC
ncbi:MAG TPA: DUF2807 domain-containing protein [Sphingomicrobium sp.]|nr:DUF2807 domain-containing protein [Sphingomicrobium sp.]